MNHRVILASPFAIYVGHASGLPANLAKVKIRSMHVGRLAGQSLQEPKRKARDRLPERRGDAIRATPSSPRAMSIARS